MTLLGCMDLNFKELNQTSIMEPRKQNNDTLYHWTAGWNKTGY